jgi:uncharacterized membrane protein YfcA
MALLSAAFITLAASFTGKLTGLESSLIMMPVLTLFFPFQETLLLVAIIHFAETAYRLFRFRGKIRLKFVLSFAIPAIPGSVIAALLISSLPAPGVEKLFGIFLLAYVFLLLLTPKIKLAASNLLIIGGGFGSGFIYGFFGVGGFIRSLLISSYYLPLETAGAAVNLAALAVDSSRTAAYLLSGVRLPLPWFSVMAIFIPLFFFGLFLARVYPVYISKKQAGIATLILLALIGVRLALF